MQKIQLVAKEDERIISEIYDKIAIYCKINSIKFRVIYEFRKQTHNRPHCMVFQG